MNIEIANRLVELRKKSGLSQEQLADKLGLSRQAVSKWERAESSPDTDNLICLAKLYNVSIDDLLNTDEPAEDIVRDVKEREAEKQSENPETVKGESKPEEETSSPSEEKAEDSESASAKEPESDTGAEEDNKKDVHVNKNGFYYDGKDKKHSHFVMDNTGIHFTDDDEEFHLDKNGIHYSSADTDKDYKKDDDDDEDGSFHIHSGDKDVYVDDNGTRVVKDGKTTFSSGKDRNVSINWSPISGITVEERGKKKANDKMFNMITGMITSALFLIAVAAYITVGCLIPSFWSTLWIVFLAPIVIMSIPEAIHKERWTSFNMAVLVTAVYLGLGLYLNLWHPGWVIFLLIPIYYTIASMIDKIHFKEITESEESV